MKLKVENVEINVIDPENVEFFEYLAKRRFQQKKLNLEYKKKEENRIDEEIEKKEEQIEQLESVITLLKNEISSLEKSKNLLEDKTFFDEKSYAEQNEQIELEIKKREVKSDKFSWEEEFDLKCQIYEQTKDNMDWLDFELTKELYDGKLDTLYSDTDDERELTENEKWFYSQKCPIELTLNLSATLLEEFKETYRALYSDDFETFLKKREESFLESLDYNVNYFYVKLSLYLACKKFFEELREEFYSIELDMKRIFRFEIEFEEQYNKMKEGK